MPSRVEVYEMNIRGMFKRSGEAGRWAVGHARDIARVADLEAPIGGAKSLPSASRGQRPIKGSHRVRFIPRSFNYSAGYQIQNESGHAAAVHEGTLGANIESWRRNVRVTRRRLGRGRYETNVFRYRKASWMRKTGRMKFIAAGGRTVIAGRVKGQQANPWLARAAAKVEATA